MILDSELAADLDAIEREVNKDITRRITRDYDRRIEAREERLAASAGRGASDGHLHDGGDE